MTYNNELYHFGIKGMRWGVRRYQNKDGTLTNAGKKRYYDTPELNQQKSQMIKAKELRQQSKLEYNRASNRFSYLPSNKNYQALQKARDKFKTDDIDYERSKLNYQANREVARIKEKGIEFKNKSKHRLKLEEQYKKMGLTEEQAQAAANGRIRTEKILAASATLTVAACAAYIANKKIRDRVDGIIKAGENMQRIEMRDTGGKLNDMFYVAKGKHDMNRYEGMLGMARKNATGHAYLMKLEAQKDVRVASKDHAAKVFGELYKNDSEFRRTAKTYAERHFNGSNKVNTSNLSNRNIKKMYENFNANLIDIRNGGSGIDQKFYQKLKSAGYGAIQDVNDMKYSGYNAKNPLIVFDGANKNIMVKSVTELTGDLNKKGYKELGKAMGEQMTKDAVEKLGAVSAASLTAMATSVYVSDPSKSGKKQTKK